QQRFDARLNIAGGRLPQVKEESPQATGDTEAGGHPAASSSQIQATNAVLCNSRNLPAPDSCRLRGSNK
ncbi:MAG: hypothetical protein ABI564_17600, partial [Ideonella sp.]